MANLIQKIIVREDLDLPRGLLSAQIAHIHMEWFRSVTLNDAPLSDSEREWLKAPYIHVHSVPNIEWFNYFLDIIPSNVPHAVWKDTLYLSVDDGKSRKAFENVPVGFSIGPCDADQAKAIIGDLPLLR